MVLALVFFLAWQWFSYRIPLSKRARLFFGDCLARVMRDTFKTLQYFVDKDYLFRSFNTSWGPKAEGT